MEAGWHPEALQKLRERLCRETDPHKLYKSLKKLSYLPLLSDILAEIGFRQTIKGLRKRQLLVPFAKDLVARWSEMSLLGPQLEVDPDPDQDPQDSTLVRNLNSESLRNSPEEKAPAPASGKPQDNEREVLEVSSGSPGPSRKKSAPTSTEGTTTGSGSLEPGGKKIRRCRKIPLCWSKGDAPSGSFEECFSFERSPSPTVLPLPSLKPLPLLPPCKRKRKSSWKAEARSPGVKVLRGQSSSCNALSPSALSRTPESHRSRQACIPWHGLEPSSWSTNQEAKLWANRMNFQKPVYSGPRPAGGLLPNSCQGLLLVEDPAGTLGAHHQAVRAKALEGESEQSQEESPSQETQPCKQTHRQTETQTHLQLKVSQKLRLQALRARIQSRQAEARQGSLQTKMAAFHTQVKSPDQQEESGPQAEAPFSENHLLHKASTHSLTQEAPCLPSGVGGSNKREAKKRPPPLMAKALRDYQKSFLGR
ncbi:elongin-A3 member D-like [Acomys russatus]|uniref:elongin-A3 member D-like n=1 Tax=Acomys russatus TaxID=60746 RepID=UPI0021E24E3F|nr:elongin-A3 member D-like [Acomys russatus]